MLYDKFPIYDSSPIVTNSEEIKRSTGNSKYPWYLLDVGKSFTIKDSDVGYNTIVTSCYRWSKKLKRTFKAYKHDGVIEVARLQDPPATVMELQARLTAKGN
jgi:hypothetical protein